jgi:hypothetical protein
VTNEPHINVKKVLIFPSTATTSAARKSRAEILAPSPAIKHNGRGTTALKRLVYQESRRAPLSTTARLCLNTREWIAVIAEQVAPKKMPSVEAFAPSRKTPTKKPRVTMVHATRMQREGRVLRMTEEMATVKGRTRPRATW